MNLSTEIHRQWTQGHSMGERNLIKLFIIPSDCEDSELGGSDSEERFIPDSDLRGRENTQEHLQS